MDELVVAPSNRCQDQVSQTTLAKYLAKLREEEEEAGGSLEAA